MINIDDKVLFKSSDSHFVGIVCEKKGYTKRQYCVQYKQWHEPTLFFNPSRKVWLRHKDILEVTGKVERVLICAECGEQLTRIALFELAVTYEEDEEQNDIFKQVWHRRCLIEHDNRQKNKQREI